MTDLLTVMVNQLISYYSFFKTLCFFFPAEKVCIHVYVPVAVITPQEQLARVQSSQGQSEDETTNE